jgi:molecular chaperone DnaK
MVDEAQSHAKDDQERRERIEKKNLLDSMIYGAEKTLRDNQDKLPDDVRQAAEGVLAEARKELDSEDAARLDTARQRVEQEMHKVAEILYKSQAEAGAAASAAPAEEAASEGEDVIDAEYTEEKGDG